MSVEQRNRAQGLCYLAGSAKGFLRSAGAGPAQGRFSPSSWVELISFGPVLLNLSLFLLADNL